MFQELSIKNKTMLLITSALVVFSIVLFSVIYINQKEKQIKIEEEHFSKLQLSYKKILNKHNEFYTNRIKANINSLGVKVALATKDRDELYDLTKGRWDSLVKENKYLKVMHFHNPDGTSFLRMHQPQKFGDDIAHFRPMVTKIHELKKPLYGFEAGIFNLAYRTFVPIFYQDKYIGALEFGSRPDDILNEMDYFNDIQGALFVKNNSLNLYKEDKSFQRDNYTLQYSTLKDDSLVNSLPENYNFKSQSHILINDKKYALYAFDLKDFTGEITAKILFFNDISYIEAEFIETSKKLALLLLGLLAFLLVVVNLGFSKIIKTIEDINKRLTSNKLFMDSVLENSSHAIVATDTDGNITLFNKQAESMLGYSRAELIGKKTPALFHKREEIKQRAKEFSKELNINLEPGFEVFVAKTNAGLDNNDEWTYVDKFGKEFKVKIHITSLIDSNGKVTGYLGMSEDITDSKRKEKQIKDYISLMDKNIITSSTDTDGNITYVSEAFCEISGYTKEELMGRNHRIIRHPDMPDSTYKTLWNTIGKNETWTGEIKNRTKQNSFYWVKASISPIFDEHGTKIGYTAIRQDITDKKQIELISITDGLTNIFNRRHFNDVFPQVINSAKRDNQLVSFLIMDIDHFKQYNDTYGHQMGDDVLIKVAACIEESLSRADDYCFRLGGEEFGVIFKADSKEQALKYANTIKQNIEDLKITHEKNSASPYITASMGLVCKNANEIPDADTAYKDADDLLYVAKESGRNKVSV